MVDGYVGAVMGDLTDWGDVKSDELSSSDSKVSFEIISIFLAPNFFVESVRGVFQESAL